MKIAGILLPPPIADAVRACRPHFVAAAIFSALINLLYLAPALYEAGFVSAAHAEADISASIAAAREALARDGGAPLP